MKLTCHSEVGKLHSIFVKRALDAFISDEHISQFWASLNYTEKPNFEMALKEYTDFESEISNISTQVKYIPSDVSVNIDSIYCRDAGIVTDLGMVICNMGKLARSNEPSALKKACEANGIKVLGEIKGAGTLEGGDVAWLDENTLAVGHTYRSNEEGIRQLKELIAPLKVNVITIPLPHYKGPSDVFHLMSILSPVDHRTAVVYSPLMPICFRNYLLEKEYQLVEVPDEEFETMGCNVLALAPGLCLMVGGNHKTKALLESVGC